MPHPATSQGTQLRSDLGTLMEFDLAASRSGFIAQRVAPVLEVAQQSDKYGVVSLESLLKDQVTNRSEGAGYNQTDVSFTDDSYATVEHGLEGVLDSRRRNRYRELIDAEMAIVSIVRDGVLRNYEKRVAALLFNSTTFSGQTANGTDWGAPTTGTPMVDVEGAVVAVRDQCGLLANAVIMSWTLFRQLRFVDEIIDRLKYSGHTDVTPGKITPQMLAGVFDVEQVIVAGGQKNGAIEGAAAADISDIWDPTMCLVARIATSNMIEEPCIARTFHWGEDGSNMGETVEQYYDERRRGDVYRVRMDTDEKIPMIECGYLLTGLDA